MAYEAAWTSGICNCECDIALTKDERIILAHDENFSRLGMDPTSPLCNRTVRDLTFKGKQTQRLQTCYIGFLSKTTVFFNFVYNRIDELPSEKWSPPTSSF